MKLAFKSLLATAAATLATTTAFAADAMREPFGAHDTRVLTVAVLGIALIVLLIARIG